jgi:hypothetical protein
MMMMMIIIKYTIFEFFFYWNLQVTDSLITLCIHRIRVTNDTRSAVTIQIKENHHQHRTVSRVIWGFAVFITL